MGYRNDSIAISRDMGPLRIRGNSGFLSGNSGELSGHEWVFGERAEYCFESTVSEKRTH